MRYWTASTRRTDLKPPASRASSAWTPTGTAHAVEATDANRESEGRTTLCSRPAVQGDLWAFEHMDFEGNGVRQSQIVTRCPECVDLVSPPE
jgi:hypothetical protein